MGKVEHKPTILGETKILGIECTNKSGKKHIKANKGISFKTNILTGQTLYDVDNIAYPKVWFSDIGNA